MITFIKYIYIWGIYTARLYLKINLLKKTMFRTFSVNAGPDNRFPSKVFFLRSYFAHTSNISRLSMWLVQVSQGLVCFLKLKLIRLNVQHRLPSTAKRAIVLVLSH